MTEPPKNSQAHGQPDDERLLRVAMEIADQAVGNGNHPFGALLTDPDSEIVLSAENTVVTDRDVTGHAETNLVRLASRRLDRATLAGCSLYTSCEPCAMCAGAIYWAGIGRVLYALAESSLLAITGSHPENPTLALPCRQIFAAGQRPTAVSGPMLEDEAALPHRTFWLSR